MTTYPDLVLVEDNHDDIEMIKDALKDAGENINTGIHGRRGTAQFFQPDSR